MTLVTDHTPGPTPPPERPVGTTERPAATTDRPVRPPAPTPMHQTAAEWFLALVTVAVVVSFGRVFSGAGYAGPLIVMALAMHGGLALARRRGIGLGLSSLLAVVAFVFMASWLLFGSTTRLLFPTTSTLDTARSAVESSWRAFQQVVAPTHPQPGFMLVAALAVCFAVFLADWAAFRLWAPIEALVPTLTLFGFTAFVGSARFQVFATLLYAATALLFVLEHRVAQRERTTTWLANQVERGSSWLVRVGLLATAVAVIGGAIVGPHLPGANQPGVVHWHGNHGGNNARVTISPLVDIQSKLNKQSDTTLFVVTSTQPAYWRLTSLDTFDGSIWRSSGRYDSANGSLSGALPAGVPDPGKKDQVTQTFTIAQLSELWLPAAYLPVSIQSPGFKVRYQNSSSTLIVDTNLPSDDNQTYTVRSVLPRYSASTLRAANPAIPSAIKAQDLSVPGLSAHARAVARRVTAGARTPYDKALALQNYFRDPQLFTYNPNVNFANDDNAIDTFLRVKQGYCQQFAGTFAALARSVGLPTRVAVGFTPGINDPTNPTRYEVKGGQAHAWPEVYLGQYGWVPFEPTPGRGAPGEAGYLGVAAQQDDNPGGGPSTSQPTETTVVPTIPSTLPPSQTNNKLKTETSSSGTSHDHGIDLAAVSSIVALVLLVGAAVYLVVVPSMYAYERRRRRAHALQPGARVRVAWLESEEALSQIGTSRRPDETAREFARRASERLPTQSAGLATFAEAADAALFGADIVDEHAAVEAEQTNDTVCSIVAAHLPLWKRVLTRLDARRVRVEQLR